MEVRLAIMVVELVWVRIYEKLTWVRVWVMVHEFVVQLQVH